MSKTIFVFQSSWTHFAELVSFFFPLCTEYLCNLCNLYVCCTNCSNGLFLFLCSGRIFDFLLTSHAHSLYTSIIGESSSRKTFSPILLNFSHLKLAALSLPACRSRFRRRRQEKSRKLPRWDNFSNNFHKFSSNFPPLPQRSALNPLLKRGRSFLRFFTRFFLAEGEKKKSTPTPSRIGQPTVKMCDGGAYFSIGSLVFTPKKKLEKPGSTNVVEITDFFFPKTHAKPSSPQNFPFSLLLFFVQLLNFFP